MANALKVPRQGAVGFIVWLGILANFMQILVLVFPIRRPSNSNAVEASDNNATEEENHPPERAQMLANRNEYKTHPEDEQNSQQQTEAEVEAQ